jgi:cell division protein FtsN
MKKSTLLLTVIFVIATIAVSCGPKDEELKIYAKMTPEQIRQMKMNYEAKLKDAAAVKTELKASGEREDSLLRLYNAASAKLKMANTEISSALEEAEMAKSGVEKGIVFKVQIGAFKAFNMNDQMTSANGMTVVKEDGLNKYYVGSFKTFDQANSFKKDLAKIGVKGGFVVAFQDGVKTGLEAAKIKTGGKK